MKTLTEYINEALKFSVTSLLSKGVWHQWCEDIFEGKFMYKDTFSYIDPENKKRTVHDKMDTFEIAKAEGPEQAAADLLATIYNSPARETHYIPSNDQFKNLTDWFLKCDDKDFAEECAAEYLAGLLEILEEAGKKYLLVMQLGFDPQKIVVLKRMLEKNPQTLSVFYDFLKACGYDMNKIKSGDYSELPDYFDDLQRLCKTYKGLKDYGF